MFLSNSTGPNSGTEKLQRLGFAYILKGITHYCLNQLKNSKGCFAIGFYPVFQVLPKLWLEDGLPWQIGLRFF